MRWPDCQVLIGLSFGLHQARLGIALLKMHPVLLYYDEFSGVGCKSAANIKFRCLDVEFVP